MTLRVFPVARSGTLSTVATSLTAPETLRIERGAPFGSGSAQCLQAIARAPAKDEVSDAPRPRSPTAARRGPKSCCVKVVRLKGKYVRSPASRPPSRCGPSSGKHPNIRTSHPVAPALECSDVRLVGQETRKRVVEVRCPVTVPREISSLSRMKDDRTNIIVSQQRRIQSHRRCRIHLADRRPGFGRYLGLVVLDQE